MGPLTPEQIDDIPMPRRLRRTEMRQSPDGDWFVDIRANETIVGIDFSPMNPTSMGMSYPAAGGGGGGGAYPRTPVIWILCDEVLTEMMGK